MKDESWRRPGFTIPGNARSAALKALESPDRHRWTADEARKWQRINVERRRAAREQTQQSAGA